MPNINFLLPRMRRITALAWAVLAAVVVMLATPLAAYAQATGAAGGNELELGLIALLAFGARQLAVVVAKLIPDSTTGFWGVFRMLLKFASGYVKNRE